MTEKQQQIFDRIKENILSTYDSLNGYEMLPNREFDLIENALDELAHGQEPHFE